MELNFISDVEKERVDVFLSAKAEDLSRSYVKKIAEAGGVFINEKVAKASEKLKIGDHIRLLLPELQKIEAKPQQIDFELLYEDTDIIVVNKPRGMVVHPAAGNYEGTLVNALLGKYGDQLSNINGKIRPGIVHRIDKDTTGVLVVARNNAAHEALSQLFKTHDIKREYIALVEGLLKHESGTVDAPIGRHPTERKKMAVNTKTGRRAVTHFQNLGRFKNTTLIKATLETGRTHQIRVHLAYIGHPLVGDPVYGFKKNLDGARGQYLHAQTLGFIHPTRGEYVEFKAELPEYFQKYLRDIEVKS